MVSEQSDVIMAEYGRRGTLGTTDFTGEPYRGSNGDINFGIELKELDNELQRLGLR